MSCKGRKGKAKGGINWGRSQTKPSTAEFLNRMTASDGHENHGDNRAEDSYKNENTKATIKLEELMLVWPSSMQRIRIDLGRRS